MKFRLIDLFVDSLPLSKYGFVDHKENPTSTKLSTSLSGRPAYLPRVLILKMTGIPKS